MTSTTRKLIIGTGLLGVVLVAVGIWWFLADDSPDEVSLDAAVSTITEDETSSDEPADGASDGSEGVAATSEEVAGTWQVDTETGDFDYETATGSFVGFRIEEELRTIGSTTAVGRTGDISGSLTIDGTTLTAASFDVDLTTITTESSMRDDNVQDALETAEFPTADFVLTEPIELGENPGAAATVADATGDLTIHGVTNTVTIPIEAQLVDDTIVVVGSTDVTFSDYGVEVPDGGPVISVDDFGVIEFQLLFRR